MTGVTLAACVKKLLRFGSIFIPAVGAFPDVSIRHMAIYLSNSLHITIADLLSDSRFRVDPFSSQRMNVLDTMARRRNMHPPRIHVARRAFRVLSPSHYSKRLQFDGYEFHYWLSVILSISRAPRASALWINRVIRIVQADELCEDLSNSRWKCQQMSMKMTMGAGA